MGFPVKTILGHLRRRSRKTSRHMSRRFNIQFHGERFLRDFYEASSQVGIRPFLIWGTLLGCVREGRFLRRDKDIDLGILWSDYAKKDALVAAMQCRGYNVAVDHAYKFKFGRPFCRLRIDVDVFYPWDGKMISCQCKDGNIVGTFFHQNAFDRLTEVDFLGDVPVLIPDPPAAVLTTIYGDWRTPNRHYDSDRDLLNRLMIAPGEPMPRFP